MESLVNMGLTVTIIAFSDALNSRWRYVTNAGVPYQRPPLDHDVDRLVIQVGSRPFNRRQ